MLIVGNNAIEANGCMKELGRADVSSQVGAEVEGFCITDTTEDAVSRRAK